MKQLTKAEEQIMQAVWGLDRPFLREIIECLPDPKPHQNTVSTVLKVLTDKGFLNVKPFGRMYRYIPVITGTEYSGITMKDIVKNYFQGSFKNVVSFMIKENDIDVNELELLLKELKETDKK
jgi:BlaI family penicillinase repressor